ncbi:MAG: sulfatase [Planctomycetes bacterium]|nr:sulfatase [Planctomycetota bacterium]
MKRLIQLLPLCLTLLAAADDRPNILWVTCEDMSARLPSYGDNTVQTPHLDRLAHEGVRYTSAFGTYGVCAPNRHTLIMGMYPSSTGAMAMRTWKRTSALKMITDPELLAIPVYEATPPAQAKCFTEYLRAAGYYCSNNAKTDYQMQTPITAWDDSSNTAHWRNRPTRDTPFFAVFNNTVTHESKTFKKTSPQRVDPKELTLPPYYPDTEAVRQGMAWHYDNIVAMDTWVGRVLGELAADELLEKTIVFFFSDHGDGLPRAKRWVYDSGLHVPLLIRFPDGRLAGTTNTELVSFIDFAPTVMSLTGLAIPPHMEGQAFLGPKKAPPRKYIFGFRDRMDPAPETIRAVRDGRFKYVRNYRPDLPYLGYIPYRDQAPIMQSIHEEMAAARLGPDQWQFSAKHKPLEELYDTVADPHEIRNLAADPEHFDKLAELRAARHAFQQRFGDLGMLPESELIKRLWPPAGKQPTTADPAIEIHGGLARILCESEGASIAYRISGEKTWRLYTTPVVLEGVRSIAAQAIRYGWTKSGIVELRVKPIGNQ